VKVDQVFKALGDPVRLEMVRRLADGTPYTIGNLSNGLGISRQGARKQIEVLVAAKIVQLKPAGRETQVTLDTTSLEMGRAFIAKLETQWDQRLQALKALTEQT
jgi:DNA-binding transcriptional ArsR family regulator